MFRLLRRLVVGVFALIGITVVLAMIVGGVAAWKLAARAPSIPDAIILTGDLNGGLIDGPSEDAFTRLLVGSKTTLRDFVEALERGGDDPRVKGLYVWLGDDSLGLAKVQQVRDAVRAFRAKGKFAIAFAESFGELGPGTRPYYLATAFDEIWLQPLGDVGLSGLSAEVPFLRGTLDRLGIEARFDHRSEYKTAMNTLTDTQMSGPQREETEALLDSAEGQIVRGIAEDRKLAPDQVKALIDRGPFLATDAKSEHLVDHIGYRDEVVTRAHERAGSGAELLNLSRYLEGAGRPHRSGPAIALIYGTGLIVRGGGSANPIAGAGQMAADDIARAFRDAVRDPRVRAIVFRIDSPGGSVVASETIWRAVAIARQRARPVIASMGDVAGSGGYYVAAGADKIVAEPATLTGSIGVLAGKLVIADLLKKLRISTDSAQLGATAGIFESTSGFSAAGHARLEAFLDADYQGFKNRVAAGRHMTAAAVEAVAQGRVWTGEQAKARGLVDALGGYRTALSLAREAAKIPPAAPVNLAVYPQPRGPIAFVYDRLTGRRRDGAGGPGAIGRAIAAIEPLVTRLDALIDGPVLALMPPLGSVR